MGVNTKLEDCARALADSAEAPGYYDNLSELAKDKYRIRARAVIACLMEPDETMLKEFRLWDAVSGPSYGSDDYAVESLRAMLQSVLDEGK